MTMLEIVKKENEISEMLTDYVRKLCRAIREMNVPGVAEHTDGVSQYRTVKISALAHHNFVLSSEYYNQDSQAELVEAILSRAKTANDLLCRMERMADEQRVTLSNNTYTLNPYTVKVINRYLREVREESA